MFGCEHRFLACVRSAIHQILGNYRGEFEYGSAVAGDEGWETKEEPLIGEGPQPYYISRRRPYYRAWSGAQNE